MELRVLNYFVAVADAGTVSAAAQQLHITQPGLSRQLRQLEQELKVPLFDRAAGRLTLSSAGRALLPLVRDLLERAEALRVSALFQASGRLEHFTVGAPTVTLTDVVAPFIATLGPDDPRADVQTADGWSSAASLARGADLAIGTGSVDAPYQSSALAVLPVWAYVPAAHAWAGRRRVSLSELTNERLITVPPTYTARQALDDAWVRAEIVQAEVVEVANGTVAQALAAAGRGVAVVSDDVRYGLVPLAIDLPGGRELSLRLVAVWDSRHAASATLEALANRLSDFVRRRYGASPLALDAGSGTGAS